MKLWAILCATYSLGKDGMRHVLVALVCFSVTYADADEPYDFRGAKMGMPLSEFKQQAFPDSNTPLGVDNSAPTVVCTGQPNLGTLEILLRSRGVEGQLGVVKCIWARQIESKYSSRNRYTPAALNVAGTPVSQVLYFFLQRQNDIEPRLFRILITSMNTDRFARVADGLKQRFGPPGHQEQELLQNRMGAKFSNTIMIWRKEETSIYLAERAGMVDEMLLSYRHDGIATFLQKETERLEGKPGDKL